jgi:hypothetical protein
LAGLGGGGACARALRPVWASRSARAANRKDCLFPKKAHTGTSNSVILSSLPPRRARRCLRTGTRPTSSPGRFLEMSHRFPRTGQSQSISTPKRRRMARPVHRMTRTVTVPAVRWAAADVLSTDVRERSRRCLPRLPLPLRALRAVMVEVGAGPPGVGDLGLERCGAAIRIHVHHVCGEFVYERFDALSQHRASTSPRAANRD